MDGRTLDLEKDEEIVFEKGPAILTNRRLLVARRNAQPGSGFHEALLRDIATCEKISGGRESQMQPGMKTLGAGVAVGAIEFIIPRLSTLVASLFFLAGTIGVLIGLYLILGTVTRERPHTTVLFQVLEGNDIAVSFPQRDNPDADDLIRAFNRAKRGF